MSHPHSSSIPPSAGGQTKTLFYTQGTTTAAIVYDDGKRQRAKHQKFRDEHAALSWCVKNAANMMFMARRDLSEN